MSEIVLHHYPASLYAEKIRRILAYKRLPWRSVEQPMVAPKPELTPLTGGYRRVPVLQIGADVYCDTALIARRLEQLRPDPACIPAAQAGLVAMLEEWADHRLAKQIVPARIEEMLPSLPPGILEDRAAMGTGLSEAGLRTFAPHAWSQALLSLDHLDAQLRERPFLLGDAFTLADAACYHPVWFLGRGALSAAVAARPSLHAWVRRISEFGPGEVRPMAAAEALEVARAASPADLEGASVEGPAPGSAVAIVADDYGREEVVGTVARVTAESLTIRREDPALGEIAVHFPRMGYRVITR